MAGYFVERMFATILVDGHVGAFAVDRGGCFRLVYDEHSQPVRCPEPVVTEGWFCDRSGRWHSVDACHEHARQLAKRCPAG
jgi:hypothetical protein